MLRNLHAILFDGQSIADLYHDDGPANGETFYMTDPICNTIITRPLLQTANTHLYAIISHRVDNIVRAIKIMVVFQIV